MKTVIGWDIGGVNVKATRLQIQGVRGRGLGVEPKTSRPYTLDPEPCPLNPFLFRTASRYFEIWKEREALPSILRDLQQALGPADAMGVTMTAELSDAFRGKREGVGFVFEKVKEAFPGIPLYALDLEGNWRSLYEDFGDLIAFAATNWIAEGLMVAEQKQDCLLIDIGSTTTDIIPILDGRLAAQGRTDTDRLISGELVYTGTLRTPVYAITPWIPVKGLWCRTSPELFAIAADVYLILGNIQPGEYTCNTPDGREKTRECSRERLARAVCADATILTEEEIFKMATYLAEQQAQQIVKALMQVLSRIEGGLRLPVIATGSGAFLVERCARRLGLMAVDIRELLGPEAAVATPSLATAYLLAKYLTTQG